MFATGLPQLGQSFFTASSIVITIPTGVQFFCWLATLWKGRLRPTVPMLYVLGFFSTFVMGGVTGVMLAAVPLNLQLHDTFFVVAHLHYVLIGGAIFPLLGAVYYWFPKMTGRMMNDRAGHVSFWLAFLGFNLTFFPMHQLGLYGMPRRVYTYLPEMGWGRLNLLSSIGAGVLALGMLLYLGNAVASMKWGRPAGPDPWDAPTLEWATDSPPPPYNFLYLPVVTGPEPLWHEPEKAPVVTGLSATKREVLITHALDAEPDHLYVFPNPTPWPFVSALVTGIMLVFGLFTPWAFAAGIAVLMVAMTAWFWPTTEKKEGEVPEEGGPAEAST
jgi:cytochrome c oxidase subunit 1